MRRPTQRPGHAAAHGWTHPYTGTGALAVFYNDGGPAVPTPADLAARTAPAQPPAPSGPEPLIDRETGLAMTQDRFTKIMTRENAKGRKAAYKELCEAAGVPFDPDAFDPKAFAATVKEAQELRQAALSEEQRRAEDLAKKERDIEARIAAAEAREREAAARDRDTLVRSALVSLGATGDDLEDAAALLRVGADADQDAITAAAAKLKERRAELFGATPAPQQTTLPPAPSGAPAGGAPSRIPAGSKDAVTEAARRRAIEMGLRTDDAA